MDLQDGRELHVAGQAVKITHPHKILFPEDGISKGELVEYYQRIAPRMVPYLRGRPLSMQRYPGGIEAHGFFQQKAADYFPDWIHRATLAKEGGRITHVVCDNAATLVYLANQDMITPHVWLSRTDQLNNPDQMVFDLDPSGADFSSVKAAALGVKRLLEGMAMPVFVKTTGSRGLHVCVPLDRKENFDTVRAFARSLADELVSQAPDQWTTEQRKDKRHSRVFIDTNRNAYGQTIAPAYAVRARPGAPVSVPLAWDELERRDLRPDRWTVRNIFEKLESCEDPWKNFFKVKAHAAHRISKEAKVRRNAGTGGS